MKTGRPTKLQSPKPQSQKQTINITMPPFHPAQLEVAQDPTRFKVICAGRRWRKTSLFAIDGMTSAATGEQGWYVGPDYPMVSIIWRDMVHPMAEAIRSKAPKDFIRISETDRIILFPRTGGWYQFKSAEDPDKLRGPGLNFVYLDEARLIKERAWTEALRPALSDKKGRAVIASTPGGMDWFHRLWCRGNPDDSSYNPTWKSWQLPTSSNIFIDPEEIEDARQTLPERIFSQEYLAEFVSDAQGVFRRLDAAFTAQEQKQARKGHAYGCGVDWAKQHDFTVYAVFDTCCREVCFIDRMNQLDYYVQRDRLKALHGRFNFAWIIAEQNNMGDANIETLQREGLPISGIRATAQSKVVWIEDLASAFEKETIKIIDYPQARSEFIAIGARKMPSGLTQYQAPQGLHDDCVMSIAMGYQGLGAHQDLSTFEVQSVEAENVNVDWPDGEVPLAADIVGAF